MRFQSSGKFEQGVADVDPTASPGTILPGHILALPEGSFGDPAAALWLALLGVSTENLTLSLYFLIDETAKVDPASKFISASNRWFQFASGVVVTNGTLQTVTANIPAGGIVYARRTADTITAGQTRNLVAAWV